jgi:tetratricopeptide (TPR) repeat protein
MQTDQGSLQQAEQNDRKAISMFSNEPAWSHAAAIVWGSLAGVLAAETRDAEALAALDRASQLLASNHVTDSLLSFRILFARGVIEFRRKNLHKAEHYFLQALDAAAAEQSLGSYRWQILNSLGRVYHLTKRFAKAENAYNRSMQIAESQLGRANPKLSVILIDLGSLYAQTGRDAEAATQFQRSLSNLEEAAEPFDQMWMMKTLYGLGELHLREGDEVRARPLLARAAEIAEKRTMAIDMPVVVDVLEAYATTQKSSNAIEAERLHAQARRIRSSMAFTTPVGRD